MSQVKVIDKLQIKPAGEFILVSVDPEEETKTSGSIIVPTAALANKKTQTGTIVEVGEGRRNPHNPTEKIPMDCAKGQRILFACFIGYPFVINGVEHVIIKHNDIMAFVDEESHYVDYSEGMKTDEAVL